MYAPFFGLSKEPFSIAPDPRFLFMSEQHREALAHLLYGLGGGGGFVLLTGEIGAGKTTVFRCFLEQVPAHCTVAYVFNPKLTATELLQTVCGEFGITSPAGGVSEGMPPAEAGSVKAHVDALNAFLLDAHAQGRQAVLVIDEAQALSADVLEQLRLLTNLETAERKLLQIVLIGQPELRQMLARPELEQLAQRVIARYHLGALTLAETQQYIRHRLSVAGPAAPLPFDAAALKTIHRLSGGVPRRVNLLADRALLGAYAQGLQRADKRTVLKAAREVFGGEPPVDSPRRWAYAAGLAVAVGAVGALGVWAWQQQRSPSATSVAMAALSASSSPAVKAAAPAASAAPSTASDDPAALLAAAPGQAALAWRELALRWNVAIGEGDPCQAVLQARLACFRSSSGGLPVVRQLARPGVLTLRRPDGTAVHAVLEALDAQQARLQAGGQRFELTLPALASVWRGEYATFWRTPPGWKEGGDVLANAQARAWVETQLSAAAVAPGRALRERVQTFQIAQGLPADGVPGPMTLMRLAAASPSDEPRLGGVR
jgi:general secretion pathway protein A